MDKNLQVKNTCPKDNHGNSRKMVCLIKLLPGSSYSSMVNILDEMEITGTEVYTLQEPLPDEIEEVRAMAQLADNR